MDRAIEESEIKSQYRSLIELAVQAALETFGSASLPTTQAQSMWLVPTEPGRLSNHTVTYEVRDIGLFWGRCRNRLRSAEQWNQARVAVDRYIELIGAKPGGAWIVDTEIGYLERTLDLYFDRAGAFKVELGIVSQVVDELIAYLNKDSIDIVCLFALEDFSAPNEFHLGDNARVRPIRQEELREFGLIREGPIRPGFTNSGECPQSEWWICEAHITNPKGTFIGWNYAQAFQDKVRLGLHLFKEGRFSVIPLRTFQLEPFERMMSGFGGLRTWGSRRGEHYSLSSDEFEELNEFWQQYQEVVDQDNHYLQLPGRRLDTSAARAQAQDAIVDYVIGLEGLLSTASERTEIRYRFAVRGSVILAEKPDQRPLLFRQLKNLYDLRSAIVHGGTPTKEDLEAALSLGETALRKCWKWYLEHYRTDKDNKKGVERIDELLLLTR